MKVCKACGLLDELQSYLKDPSLGAEEAANITALLQAARDQMHDAAHRRAVIRRDVRQRNPPPDEAMSLQQWIKVSRERAAAESARAAPAYQAAAESARAKSSAGSRDSGVPPYYP